MRVEMTKPCHRFTDLLAHAQTSTVRTPPAQHHSPVSRPSSVTFRHPRLWRRRVEKESVQAEKACHSAFRGHSQESSRPRGCAGWGFTCLGKKHVASELEWKILRSVSKQSSNPHRITQLPSSHNVDLSADPGKESSKGAESTFANMPSKLRTAHTFQINDSRHPCPCASRCVGRSAPHGSACLRCSNS